MDLGLHAITLVDDFFFFEIILQQPAEFKQLIKTFLFLKLKIPRIVI